MGAGDLSKKGFAENRAMGGLAVSMRRHANINYINPASYSALDSLSFIFDVGGLGNYYNASSEGVEETLETTNLNIHHMSVAFPITGWLKTSIGVVPYSTVGYNIREDISTGYTAIDQFYKGSGGINQFYVGNSVELFDRLSLGVNVSYLFGSINDERRISYEDPNKRDTQIENKYVLGDLYLDYGIQYYRQLNEDVEVSLGLSLNTQTNIKGEKEETVRWVSVNTTDGVLTEVYDTIHTTSGSGNNAFTMTIPTGIGIGANFLYKEKILAGIDYYMQNWETNDFRNENNRLSDYNAVHMGVEYVPDRYSITSYFDHIRYRMGAFYSNTSLRIGDQDVIDRGLTLGLGLPLGSASSSFNFAVEMGQKGNAGLVKEQYVNFLFNLTLHDFWFFKRRFD